MNIGGGEALVAGAFAQGQFEDLDQAVAGPIPRELIGQEEVNDLDTSNGSTAKSATLGTLWQGGSMTARLPLAL